MPSKGGQDCFFPDKLLKEVDIRTPPYITHYPELVGYLNPPVGAPRVSTARLNLMVRCGEAAGGNWHLDSGANWLPMRTRALTTARTAITVCAAMPRFSTFA